MYLWILAEPGLVRTLAFNAILIAGISTVIFNLNPLLRFDGYYILADWLEIPNLRQRANQYLGYLCERYLFGRREAEAPLATRGERAWFVAYAVASFLYRILVVVGILLFLGDWWFVLAVVFAAVTAVTWIGVPLGKGLVYLVSSPRLRRVRLRAIAVTAVLVAAVVGVVGFVPMPHRTRLEGVVWVPDEAGVRAGTEGFIDKVLVPSGRRVKKGDALIALRDPALLTKVQELSARRRELEARYDEQYPVDRGKADMVRDELRYVEQSLAELRRRIGELTVRSRTDGVFVVPVPEDLPGRFVKKGELLGYAVELDTVTVRAVVDQEHIELVRDRTRGVVVRLAERLDETLPGTIRRVVPGASERLPTTALGSEGGGAVPVDPRDQQGVTAVGRVFQLDVELEKRSPLLNVGGRAYLRLDHLEEPLAARWYHQLRQLFLGRFHV
jgi:putative peptide zinc metalloprotease protein